MAEQSTDTRSILNAAASIRAGQEQMQGDVDQIRAGINAIIIFSAYGVAISVLAFWLIKKRNSQ